MLDQMSKTEESLELTRTVSDRLLATGAFPARRRRYRRLISLSHYTTFWLGTRFKKAVPLMFVLGYPKSGTSWVCQLVADHFRLPFPQHSILPIGFPAVVHGHEIPSNKYPLGVYVVRDGRDVMVSCYFHMLSDLLAGGKYHRYYAVFREFDLKAPAQVNLPKFIESQAFVSPCRDGNWGKHVSAYLKLDQPGLKLLKYEDLRTDPVGAFSDLVEAMTGSKADENQVRETIGRFSFERLAGRSPNSENTNSYLRKGVVGDWRNYFNRESALAFDKHFGDALIQWGYETDRSWVESCSE